MFGQIYEQMGWLNDGLVEQLYICIYGIMMFLQLRAKVRDVMQSRDLIKYYHYHRNHSDQDDYNSENLHEFKDKLMHLYLGKIREI